MTSPPLPPSWQEALAKVTEAAEAVAKAASESCPNKDDDNKDKDKGRDVLSLLAEVFRRASSSKEEGAKTEDRQLKLMQQQHASLQTKLDKVTRQLDAMAESQAKANKLLQSLIKATKEKESSPAAAVNSTTNGQMPAKKDSDNEVVIVKTPEPSNKNMRCRWSRNMLFVGDGHWQALRDSADDVNRDIAAMERDWNLKVMSKPGETLDRMYDSQRGKLLLALPRGVEKVALSVGSKDLQDASLVTLKQDSLDKVRKANAPKLEQKAETLVRIIKHLDEVLNGPFKTILLVLPPHPKERVEIFQHWHEIVLRRAEELEGQLTSTFRVVDLPDVMKSTLLEFGSGQNFFEQWLAPDDQAGEEKNRLTVYGYRRMWDVVQRTATIRTLPNSVPANSCLRCLKYHARNPCHSLEKECRRCGMSGHFTYVHDVQDPELRKAIVCELKVDIFADGTNSNGHNGMSNSPYGAALEAGAKRSLGPQNEIQSKLLKLSGQPVAGPLTEEESYDDWYAA